MKTQPKHRSDVTDPGVPPVRRTAAYDAAIATLRQDLARLGQERREKLRDMKADPEALGKLRTQMQGLQDQIEGQQELRAEAARFDAHDDFVRERKSMLKLQDEMLTLMATRESDAEDLDRLCRDMGQVLQRIAAKNAAAWEMFRMLSRYITRGDPRPARRDSLLFANQARISTGGAASGALVAALRGAGLGHVGIEENWVLSAVRAYRDEQGITIEQAMRDANERVARHLAVVFKQTEDEMHAMQEGLA